MKSANDHPRQNPGLPLWGWALVWALGLPTGGLFAHDGVHVDVDRVNKQIEISKDPGPLYLIRAKLCRKHGRPDLALQDLNWARGLGIDPEEELLERALCLRDSGKEQKALKMLDQVVGLSGKLLVEALDERSDLRLRLGKIDGAIVDLVRVHSLEPDLAKTLRLGDLYERRDAHGLALSSRNARLNPEGLELALSLSRALSQVRQGWGAGQPLSEALSEARATLKATEGVTLEYLDAVNETSFESHAEGGAAPTHVVVAAHVQEVRLIDTLTLRT